MKASQEDIDKSVDDNIRFIRWFIDYRYNKRVENTPRKSLPTDPNIRYESTKEDLARYYQNYKKLMVIEKNTLSLHAIQTFMEEEVLVKGIYEKWLAVSFPQDSVKPQKKEQEFITDT